jgi:uncharacterized phage-associated protein
MTPCNKLIGNYAHKCAYYAQKVPSCVARFAMRTIGRNFNANRSTRTETPSERDWPGCDDSQNSDGRASGQHQVGPGAVGQGGSKGKGGRVDAGTPVGDCQGSGGSAVGVMANHDARAIANEFLRRRGTEVWPQQLSIQKLTYIAHGWNLVVNGEPLIEEIPEAWDNGPVFRSIWNHIKDYGYRGKHCTLVDPITKEEFFEPLTPSETGVIDHVWAKYGGKLSSELSDMTHRLGTPWYNAYFGRHRNAPLSNEDISRHYYELAIAGRAHRQ